MAADEKIIQGSLEPTEMTVVVPGLCAADEIALWVACRWSS